MKKKLLLVIIVLCFSFYANSQAKVLLNSSNEIYLEVFESNILHFDGIYFQTYQNENIQYVSVDIESPSTCVVSLGSDKYGYFAVFHSINMLIEPEDSVVIFLDEKYPGK